MLFYVYKLILTPDRFNDEFINLNEEDIKNNKLLTKISNTVNYIGYSYNERYKIFLIYYINKINLNKYFFIKETFNKANIILKELIDRFKIEDEDFKNYALQYLYLGILKKENNIFKIRNAYFYHDENMLLDILNIILKNNCIELFTCDKYKIIDLLKNKIFETNLNKSTEVLILLHDINLSRQATLKKELEYNFNNINFDIEYNFFKYKNSNKKYDYIIDDLDINLGSGDIFNRIKNKLLSLTIEKKLQSYQNK